MKFGFEVEGRLRGLPTIFVSAQDVLEDAQAIISAAVRCGASHIYVSDNENVLDLKEVVAMFETHFLTFDVTKLSVAPPRNCHVILRALLSKEQQDSLQLLRTDDTLKVDIERNVFCFTKGSAVRTVPSDFDLDMEL